MRAPEISNTDLDEYNRIYLELYGLTQNLHDLFNPENLKIIINNHFAERVLKRFIAEKYTSQEIEQQINLIQEVTIPSIEPEAKGRKRIMMGFLNHHDPSLDKNFSVDLFKICLRKFIDLDPPIDEEDYLNILIKIKESLNVGKNIKPENKAHDYIDSVREKMIFFLQTVGQIEGEKGEIFKKFKKETFDFLSDAVGERDSIASFFEYHENLINGDQSARVYDGTGHGSWIEKPQHYSKLKSVINEMRNTHERSIETGTTTVFTEDNLSTWLKSQFQDDKIQEFQYHNNKEFVRSLIDAVHSPCEDAKKAELEIVKDYLKDFLEKNTSFLMKIAEIIENTESPAEEKELADRLIDHLFNKMSEKKSTADDINKVKFKEDLTELRARFKEKIQEFGQKLSSNKLSDLNFDDDDLILDLILEIPNQIEDILKEGSTENRFQLNKKIRGFTEKLGKRESIFDFRETCSEQAFDYYQKAREIQASPEPKKISSR